MKRRFDGPLCRAIRFFCMLTAVACLIVLGGVCLLQRDLPDEFLVVRGSTLTLGGSVTVDTVPDTAASATGDTRSGGKQVTLRWLGLFPIKTAAVTEVERPVVLLGGTPFGIKLYTEGVLVVGLTDVDTAGGKLAPARAAGIRVNDRILSVDGTEVSTVAELSAAIHRAAGGTMTVRIARDAIAFEVRFAAVRSLSEGDFRAGLWVRDSSAGIGTMTFYDPAAGTFAGLGHAIYDVDTGLELPIRSGEAVPARVFDVIKSHVGTPGELCGGFENGRIGRITLNGEVGIYGQTEHFPAVGRTVEIAMKQDVVRGSAWIYTTIDGTTPDLYEVQIESVRLSENTLSRNMVLLVTDERLLEKTGGIVQGMSGSPILQDGRLIGAVTHVFVNDPTRGYGVFAETMWETANKAAALSDAA